jgi:hypothetical protein
MTTSTPDSRKTGACQGTFRFATLPVKGFHQKAKPTAHAKWRGFSFYREKENEQRQ